MYHNSKNMTGQHKKTVLLTGASSGIGLDAARLLAADGFRVYAAARRTAPMADLNNDDIIPVQLDITDADSARRCIDLIMEREGRIDILINNAGYGSYGPIEEVPLSEAERQMQVNVIGAMRLVQMVLPHMRAQGSGRIINTSSVAGRATTYFGGWYHASKYALEALSDALRMELAQFNIDVVLIEPGGIKTDWGIIAAKHLSESAQGTPYQSEADECAARIDAMYRGNKLSNPSVVAKAILRAATARRPRTRYLCGYMSHVIVAAHALLPARLFDRIIMKFI